LKAGPVFIFNKKKSLTLGLKRGQIFLVVPADGKINSLHKIIQIDYHTLYPQTLSPLFVSSS
jgi:hypothetical protein